MIDNLPLEFPIHSYIKNEWSIYADYDNQRSLPHLMDGLKITQRKAMYTATLLPKGDKPRVSQLASKASEITAYHHGESSMVGTVIKLAQDYPGTNNVPWLQKYGQFGTRLSNSASAPRYIHATLHDNWNNYFPKEDQEILEYEYDDGNKIEPKYFIPIIPTILVNGVNGVGNGFKSTILTYNPVDIAKACKEILKYGKVKTNLLPYIKNWKGTITKEDKQVVFTGVLKIVNTTKIVISELPPKYDNESYKKILNKLLEEKVIKNYNNSSTEDEWLWTIDCPRETTAKGVDELIKIFKLSTKVTENFVFWGINGRSPTTLNSPEEVVEEWYKHRIPLYQKSITNQINSIKEEIFNANTKMDFIEWCLKVDFKQFSKNEFIQGAMDNVNGITLEKATSLVATPMYKITKDEVAKLEDEIDSLLDKLDEIEKLTPEILMERNLKTIKPA